MRTISETELRDIIEKHQLWLQKKDGGERADLSDADLCNVDLHNANLCGADLRNTYLHSANLSNANLSNANLRHAYLSDANLFCADLCRTNLRRANLFYAILCGADLHGADLRDTNLRGANLCDANLHGAYLLSANLRGAKNINTVIWDSLVSFYPIQCPESGAFVGYKKASEHIVKLEICEDALRSSATSRKCRCSKAKVLEIQNYDGTPSSLTSVASNYDHGFIYTVGEIVEVKDFDTNRWNECAPGIHFFYD